MHAIVQIGGQQFKVKAGQELFVHKMDLSVDEKVSFDQVYLTMDGSDVKVGTPTLGLKVNATVIDHVKGDRVLIFKKKRRKGYQKLNGHRQQFTKIKVESIG